MSNLIITATILGVNMCVYACLFMTSVQEMRLEVKREGNYYDDKINI